VDSDDVQSVSERLEWPQAKLELHHHSAEDTAFWRAAGRQLLQCLESLPAVQRAVFPLHHEDGATLEELAQSLELGFETVKSRLRYALQKLRGCMQAYLQGGELLRSATRWAAADPAAPHRSVQSGAACMTELRDARLRQALQAAPDADVRPAPAVAEAIRAAARQALPQHGIARPAPLLQSHGGSACGTAPAVRAPPGTWPLPACCWPCW
jgi:hypothetical protein